MTTQCMGFATGIYLIGSARGSISSDDSDIGKEELPVLQVECYLCVDDGLVPFTVRTPLPSNFDIGGPLEQEIRKMKINTEYLAPAKFLLDPDTLTEQTIEGQCLLGFNCEFYRPANADGPSLFVRRKVDMQGNKIGAFCPIEKYALLLATNRGVDLSADLPTLPVEGPFSGHWIAKAIKHKGSLRSLARRHHLLHGPHDTISHNDFAKLHKIVDKTPSETDNRRLRLAETLGKMRGHHKSAQ